MNDGVVLYGIDAERSKNVVDLHRQYWWGVIRSMSPLLAVMKRLAVTSASRSANRSASGDKIVIQTFQVRKRRRARAARG